MNEAAKRKLAQRLELPFVRRGTRSWPEALFVKSMRDLIAHAKSNRELRRKLAEALAAESVPAPEDGESALTFESFDADVSAWTARYGKWHCYWALYFSAPAGEETEDGQTEQSYRVRLERLAAENEADEAGAKSREASASETQNPGADAAAFPAPHAEERKERSEAAEQRRIEKLNRRIEALEERGRREEERAKRLDKEAADARREAVRQAERSASLERELEAERRRGASLLEEREAAAGRLAELKRQHRQERGRLEAELAAAQEAAEEAASKLAAESARSAAQTVASAPPEATKRAELPPAPPRPAAEPGEEDADTAIRRFTALLRRDLRAAGAGLPGDDEPGDLEARTHLRRALDLLDAVDAYAAGRRLLRGGPAALPDAKPASGGWSPDEAERPEETEREQSGMAEALRQFEADEAASVTAGQEGTFYRRDHGGYIRLDNGETFNITESLVYKLQLQHEAEVWCTPREDSHGVVQYEIELLFQGDDTFSPVRQYNGYAEVDEQGVWYAVDMNDPQRRYPIHLRDLEIQRPAEGAPCIFNVGEEENVARLARVYRDFSDPASMPRRDPLPARPASSTGKTKKEGRKAKPEPFLQGSTIVVLGGQRKWFEDVVVESGANYVHENGERPDLIASDLRKAQALFLLITSTSHRAYWEGVELAKASGVPFFIIQGSKSNLRGMLWENRELIAQSNRGDGA
ncbi:hypothetical protein CDO73_17630 [Saccharibacillus sp. O23]|uniref:DUF2325 domain-containing protein n=1 Tax=Saccharibacillus sp. O23 TaxID=2009338 RepID=UPI000B671068|nr:DUF2325 domain-containing protein [Saccharibacillus sp. O23]OWR28719.1 hypothetical protein CDO73_17630 [Saccharibacillus sp. O23]